MKRAVALLTAWALLCLLPPAAAAEGAPYPSDVTFGMLLYDMMDVYERGGDPARIDEDAAELGDDIAFSIAEHWKKVYLDPDYRLYLYGKDDPSVVPVHGAHAIVVLGYELKDGEMRPELKGRCDAAAALAEAFPDSILVLSGGATGNNNPKGNTEAGKMRTYLVYKCGIDAGRIFTDTRALTTAQNAVNTFRILMARGIETMTIVTSSYHQRWGQVLYNAMAAIYRQEYDYSVEIVGNFCYDTEPTVSAYRKDALIAVRQLGEILGLSAEEMSLLPRIPPNGY